MVGQPRPARRATSRMSSAPPPYIGARKRRPRISAIETLPSRNSPISGARKNSPTAGTTRCHIVLRPAIPAP